MSIHIRVSGLANRRTFLPLAIVALAGFFCPSMMAQTAPQLLPYSVKVVAGGGAAIASGATCTSGNTSTDAYGDGCLATEILLAGPRFAVADANGNVFFSDYTNGLVRRVDAITRIVTAVAGGASASPASGTACGSYTSADAHGDGCLGTAVKLSHPMGLAFSPAGDLYFADSGYDNIRKIAATGGVITTTGVISNIAGSTSGVYGYNVNNTASGGSVIAATQSYLNYPYGIAFDSAGNLYVADEGNNAVEVINLTSAAETIQGISVAAGTIEKLTGYGNLSAKTTTADCPDFVSTGSRGGCYYGLFTNLAPAVSSLIDAPYAVATDPNNNLYFANYYNYDVGELSSTATSASWATSAGLINNFAGIQNTPGAITFPVTTRANAASFAIGHPHGVTVDSNSNVYITDSTNGTIWRVDGAGQYMYPVAGGVSTVCTQSQVVVPGATVDTYGDGCLATSAKFGTGTTGGIFGVSVDAYSDLFVGDTTVPLIREVASGTQFGPIGANQPTQYVDIHFAAGDGPASSTPYQLTDGAANFSLGTSSVVCTTNSDTTKDCVLPITATPSTTGAFTGTLEVMATNGGPASFPLSGTYVATPLTRTVVTATQAASCTNTAAYSTSTPVTLTATLYSSGANNPTGTVAFYANGTQIGTAQTLANGTSATLTYTFSTAGNYAITATYSGDSYYEKSTSSALNITSAVPSLGTAAVTSQLNTVSAGQTALYSFSLAQNVYSGTITFACSGLPANSSCVFSPSSISASGCQASSTITMSILTQGTSQVVQPASLGGAGRGLWQALGILFGVGLALLVGVRRRQVSLRYGQIWLALALLLTTAGIVSCNGISAKASPTPAGTYTVSVTATGSGGITSSFTVPLTVK